MIDVFMQNINNFKIYIGTTISIEINEKKKIETLCKNGQKNQNSGAYAYFSFRINGRMMDVCIRKT